MAGRKYPTDARRRWYQSKTSGISRSWDHGFLGSRSETREEPKSRGEEPKRRTVRGTREEVFAGGATQRKEGEKRWEPSPAKGKQKCSSPRPSFFVSQTGNHLRIAAVRLATAAERTSFPTRQPLGKEYRDAPRD